MLFDIPRWLSRARLEHCWSGVSLRCSESMNRSWLRCAKSLGLILSLSGIVSMQTLLYYQVYPNDQLLTKCFVRSTFDTGSIYLTDCSLGRYHMVH